MPAAGARGDDERRHGSTTRRRCQAGRHGPTFPLSRTGRRDLGRRCRGSRCGPPRFSRRPLPSETERRNRKPTASPPPPIEESPTWQLLYLASTQQRRAYSSPPKMTEQISVPSSHRSPIERRKGESPFGEPTTPQTGRISTASREPPARRAPSEQIPNCLDFDRRSAWPRS